MDQLAIELVKPVVKKSWKEIMLAKDLDSDMKALKEKGDLIEAVLADANSSGSCRSSAQQLMLHRLARAHQRIDDLLDKRATRAEQRKVSGGGLRTKVRLFFSPSNPLFDRFKDARKVKNIGKEIDLIVNDATLGTVVKMVPEEKEIQLRTGPFPNTDFIGGRDVERNDLVAKLCNSSNDQESLGLSTVAIVGIGGQGKSTLAHYVYSDPRVINYFGVRVWVFATPNIGLEDLLRDIIANATDEKPPSDCTISQLHYRLVKVITGKKFLLVLDNIWDQDKLKENWDQLRVLLLHGDSGSKVLVTTRSKEVARIMGSPDPYVLNDLTNENAWPFFQHFAFTLRPESRVEAIGKEIFNMCPKIPLVLKVIGQHLSQECPIDQWRDFKDALAKNSSFKGKDMIMEILKLSYDRLYEKLKQCVVYCSLFPKGMIYDVDKMIRLWIALGYVEAGDKSLEDVGQEYVQMLANLVFFQHVVEDEFSNIIKFKMHDVIHDLMLSESKSQCKMVDSETTEIEENICHVSFLWTRTRYEFDWDTRSSSSTSKQPLKSILMVKSDSNCLSGFGQTFGFRSGYDELIRRFQVLKVLDVHGLGISEVPASLGKLIYLRYLDLSENKMERLPKSITQLLNLLSLDLSHCYNLKELPNDISKLYKLRYLKLYKCINLTYMPKGLGKLKDLQNLDWFIVGHVNGDVMGGLDELSDLVNLKGRLIITMAVESKYIVSQGRIAPLGRKDKLTELEIQFEKGAKEDEMVLEGLRPQGEKLMRMNIFGYGGKNLPSWMRNEQLHFDDLPNLRLIWMTNANACAHYMLKKKKRMLASECGPWLQIDLDNDNLLLESMPGFIDLKKQLTMNVVEVGFDKPDGVGSRGLILRKLRISEQLAASQSFQQRRNRIFFKTWFPKLRLLMIDRIPELEVLPEEFRGLSFLETLEFCDCPKLKALPDWLGTLTSLKRIRLQNCPEFETIPHQISNLSQLVRLYIGPLLSEVLVERCRKPTGELWPSIQHIDSIHMSYYAGDRNRRHTFTYSRNEQ